ncbi:MAG: hypothetical protein MR419_09730 [Clostridiales bacterium]|nr:hypothetical protein [Clostridiales bacterium]
MEKHLQACPACQEKFAQLRQNVLCPTPDKEKTAALKRVQRSWKRERKCAFGKGAALMALALTLVLVIPLLAAFLTTPRYPVPAEDIQVSQVCQLEDGTVVFHLYIDDGLVLERLTFDTVETQEGSSLYYIPLHPILKTKRTDDKGFCNIYTSFRMVDPLKSSDPGKGDLDVPDWIKSVYVGSPGDGVLVWQEGMELPKATPAMEELMDHSIGIFSIDSNKPFDWDNYYKTYSRILGNEMAGKGDVP